MRCAASIETRCPCCPASRSGKRCCCRRQSPTKSPGMPDASLSTAPRGEVAALVAVQSALSGRPGVLQTARGLSHFGEHSVGWLLVELLGAVLKERPRRGGLAAGGGTCAR